MGVCVCKAKVQQSLREYICNELLLAIENGKREEVEVIYERFMRKDGNSAVFDVDSVIITLQDVPLNALAYSFRAGQTDIAHYLITTCSASLSTLYETYELIGRTPLDIACEYGFLSLVQFFLPIHLREGVKYHHTPSPHESMEELSIFVAARPRVTMLQSDITLRVTSPYQPAIHRACEHGHLDVVKYLYLQFKGKQAPVDCDINALDDKVGENCALIAARSGNLAMIRFLHEECGADFHRLNRRRENAIQIAVTGSKRKPSLSFLPCVKYMVETIGVDVTYAYEETLLVCEDKSLVFYLENQLYIRGIIVTKSKIDQDNSLSRKRSPRQMSKKSQEMEQKCRAQGSRFQIKDLIEASKSEDISSIPVQSEYSGLLTPF